MQSGRLMAETDQIPLDDYELDILADKMSQQSKKIGNLKHPYSWRLLLELYRQQIYYPKQQDWTGIHGKGLATLAKVSNESRYLKILCKLGLVRWQQDPFSSAREKKYSLTDDGRLFVEDAFQKSEKMFLTS